MTSWTDFVKQYAADNKITYKEALQQAKEPYKNRNKDIGILFTGGSPARDGDASAPRARDIKIEVKKEEEIEVKEEIKVKPKKQNLKRKTMHNLIFSYINNI